MAITSNLVNNQELKETMKETLQFLADILRNTLGPYGSTTIIQDQMLNHQITKDGYSLLKQIYIQEDVPRTILDMVKKISRTLVRKVGDGSTSSIIIANSLYNELTEIMDKYKIPPKNLLTLLDEIANVVADEIKSYAKPVSEDMHELVHVAAVSTNNDVNYGTLITEIFKVVGKYGFIDLQKSKTERTYYEITNGIELPNGFIIPQMSNQPDDKTAEYEGCKVFVTNGILGEDDIPFVGDVIGRVCLERGTPLLIIAKGYDQAFGTFLHVNLTQNRGAKPPVVAVDLAMNNKKNQDRLSDICVAVCADLYDKMNMESTDQPFDLKRLGECNRVVATEKFCRLIEGQGDQEKIQARVKMIKEKLEEKSRNEGHIELDEEVYDLRKRIAALEASLAVLYIGGKSEDAKDTDKYLLEDAVFACRSALNFGIIPGGNLIVPLILDECSINVFNKVYKQCKDLDKQFIADVIGAIRKSFLESYATVLNNKYLDINKSRDLAMECIRERKFINLKTGKTDLMSETVIINSAETDIEILKSAISIIGLLATSNQFISLNLQNRH